MPTITIHAGDWGKGTATFDGKIFKMPRAGKADAGELSTTWLKNVEVATENSVKRVGGTLGWGVVGALALGPVGMLAGLLVGGQGKDVTFIAVFRDERKFLATTDNKTFLKIQATVF